MIGGLLSTSILSGQLISRTGRYRASRSWDRC